MAKGGGGGTTATQATLPTELQGLYQNSANNIVNAQARNPIQRFEGGGAFGSAPRAGELRSAESRIGNLSNIGNRTPQSRGVLNNGVPETQLAQRTAQSAVQGSGQIAPQFAQLRGIGDQQVGPQAQEVQGIQRAAGVQRAAGQTPQTYFNVRQQSQPLLQGLINQGDRQVTGANIQNDPAFQAANQAFLSQILPQVQNSASLAGLGRSTGLQQSLASAQAQTLLPTVQDALAREERGIDRALGTRQFNINTANQLGLEQAGAEERAIGRAADAGQFTAGLETTLGQNLAQREETRIGRQGDAALQQALAGERGTERTQNALQFLSGQQAQAGAQTQQRNLEALYADERNLGRQYQAEQDVIGNLTGLGQLEQARSQGDRDRQTQDFLRRQALAETALYQPFGQIAPSTVGQISQTSGGGKGGKK